MRLNPCEPSREVAAVSTQAERNETVIPIDGDGLVLEGGLELARSPPGVVAGQSENSALQTTTTTAKTAIQPNSFIAVSDHIVVGQELRVESASLSSAENQSQLPFSGVVDLSGLLVGNCLEGEDLLIEREEEVVAEDKTVSESSEDDDSLLLSKKFEWPYPDDAVCAARGWYGMPPAPVPSVSQRPSEGPPRKDRLSLARRPSEELARAAVARSLGNHRKPDVELQTLNPFTSSHCSSEKRRISSSTGHSHRYGVARSAKETHDSVRTQEPKRRKSPSRRYKSPSRRPAFKRSRQNPPLSKSSMTSVKARPKVEEGFCGVCFDLWSNL